MPEPLTLEARLQRLLEKVNGDLAVKRRVERELAEVQQQLTTTRQQHAANEEAKLVIAAVEETQQGQLKQKLEKIVSYALSTIFERNYVFSVTFEARGQQSDATFKVMDEHGVPQELRNAHGGGLMVVTAFLLRVIVLLSAKPPLRRFISFDEPFIQVSEAYRVRLVEFIQSFAKSADMQFLFVTHEPELAAIGDKCYRFKLVGGVTHVEPA